MPRPYVRAHEPMLIEWLTKTYSGVQWRTNVRLGKPAPSLTAMALTPNEKRMLMITLHTADAVVLLPDQVHIIEVATEPKVEKICQVELYKHLFKMTEEFREHWDKPIVGIIVSTVSSELVSWFASEHNIRWVVYVPIWWPDHVRIRQARKFTASSVQPPSVPQEKE